MKNFVQDDDIIVATAPRTLSSGDGCLIGAGLFGVAQTDAASGALVPLVTEGVFDLVKAAGETWTEGEVIYWHDGTVKQASNSSGGNSKIGVAVLLNDAMPGSSDVIGRVRLNGMVG